MGFLSYHPQYLCPFAGTKAYKSFFSCSLNRCRVYTCSVPPSTLLYPTGTPTDRTLDRLPPRREPRPPVIYSWCTTAPCESKFTRLQLHGGSLGSPLRLNGQPPPGTTRHGSRDPPHHPNPRCFFTLCLFGGSSTVHPLPSIPPKNSIDLYFPDLVFSVPPPRSAPRPPLE